jgi:hypothetical protein
MTDQITQARARRSDHCFDLEDGYCYVHGQFCTMDAPPAVNWPYVACLILTAVIGASFALVLS